MSKTSRKIWMKCILLPTVLIFTVTGVGYADQITIGPNARTFTFINPQPDTAIDFQVQVINRLGGPGIGGGNGGAAFPGDVDLLVRLPEGGFAGIIYNAELGTGAGVPPGEKYTHSFPDWNEGVVFCVFFSYPGAVVIELTPVTSAALNFCSDPLPGGLCPDGQTAPVPEVSTILLLGTGLAGVAIKTRKRLKSRKSVQGDE